MVSFILNAAGNHQCYQGIQAGSEALRSQTHILITNVRTLAARRELRPRVMQHSETYHYSSDKRTLHTQGGRDKPQKAVAPPQGLPRVAQTGPAASMPGRHCHPGLRSISAQCRVLFSFFFKSAFFAFWCGLPRRTPPICCL